MGYFKYLRTLTLLTHHPKWQLDSFTRFRAAAFFIDFNGPPHIYPQNCPLPSGNEHLHAYGTSLRPTPPTTSNGIQIYLAIFPELALTD